MKMPIHSALFDADLAGNGVHHEVRAFNRQKTGSSFARTFGRRTPNAR